MKVRAKVDVVDEPVRRENSWPPDHVVRVSVALVIEDAHRGDGVAGALDKSWAGIRHAIEEGLRRR